MTSHEESEADLVVLVPDKTFAAVITALLTRQQALGTRQIASDVYVHPQHDPGCAKEAGQFLRPFLPTHGHAVVLFDFEGSGCGRARPPEIEDEVRKQLCRSGWEDRADAIVLDPELEVWAWSESPEVENCLGWSTQQLGLRRWLEKQGVWSPDAPKPSQPKEALRAALRRAGSGPPPTALVRLARSVGLRRCTDRAFLRFRNVLRRWFPHT